jgi:tripartite-type tricarboxylate transporter receptor subunit TctC
MGAMGANFDQPAPPTVYPVGPVTLVEPFGAGGGPDVVARPLANELSQLWHQAVSVRNHPGGGSTAAPSLVANAAADGYTLLVNTSAHAYSAAALADLPYDPLHDFIPVAPLSTQPYVLVAGKPAGIKTLGELIQAARACPGELRFATTGIGTGTHIGLEELNLMTGISAVHRPPGSNDAISDVVAGVIRGESEYMMSPISIVQPHVRAGELTPLGISTITRSRLLPEVPTIHEGGAPGYDFPIWYGVWAPAGTPPAIIEKLSADISTAITAPDFARRLGHEDAQPISMTQQRFARFVLDEKQRAAEIIQRARADHGC